MGARDGLEPKVCPNRRARGEYGVHFAINKNLTKSRRIFRGSGALKTEDWWTGREEIINCNQRPRTFVTRLHHASEQDKPRLLHFTWAVPLADFLARFFVSGPKQAPEFLKRQIRDFKFVQVQSAYCRITLEKADSQIDRVYVSELHIQVLQVFHKVAYRGSVSCGDSHCCKVHSHFSSTVIYVL